MRSYWCFLSYRHADNKEAGQQWASWLHQAIETYEVPEDLVGTTNGRGDEIPERIFPVFRDEEELPADADLAAPIARALDQSKTLVVLCSPRAVESKYVADEILVFKQQGKSDRIMAALLAGEPNASRNATSEAEECFPKPLLHPIGEDGQLLEDEWAEPIAADFRLRDGSEGWTSPAAYRQALEKEGKLSRSERDHTVTEYGKQLELAKLKVIAGILGVPLGTLTKRDKAYQLVKAKRRARVFRVVAGVMSLLAIAALVSGVFAGMKQKEAEEERGRAELAAKAEKVARGDAEGLVSFLTLDMGRDFRGYLPVRIQEQIKEEVEAYFLRRKNQEDLEPSKEAWGFLFQLANLQWTSGDIDGAEKSFMESVDVAVRLGKLNQDSRDAWRGLAGKSLGWMAEMLMQKRGISDDGTEAILAALNHFEILFVRESEEPEWKEGVAINKTRLADVYLEKKEYAKAERLYREAEEMRRELMEADTESTFRIQRYGVALNRMGALFFETDRLDESYRAYFQSDQAVDKLLKLEPGNRVFLREKTACQSSLANIETKREKWEAADRHFAYAVSGLRELLVWDPANQRWVDDLVWIYIGWRDSYVTREDWVKAMEVNEQVMAKYSKRVKGPEMVVEDYFSLAMSQRSQSNILVNFPDRFEEALVWLRKSEETLASACEFDPSHDVMRFQRGIAANWLASMLLWREEGKEEALDCLDRAKEIWTSLKGVDEEMDKAIELSLEEQAELYEKARAVKVESASSGAEGQ